MSILLMGSRRKRALTDSQTDYLFDRGLIKLICIHDGERIFSPLNWETILSDIDRHDKLYCSKCGCSWDVHNDDGSCVEEN
jgi:hypothetical protein